MASGRRTTAVMAVSALGVSLLVAGTVAAPAEAVGCKATPTLLSRTAISNLALPGGATVRIWDTGNLANDLNEVRLSVVRIPAGSLTPAVITSPTVARAATPLSMAQRDGRAVVIINGQHFNPTVGGIPEKSEIVGGVLRKGNAAAEMDLVAYGASKTLAWTQSSTKGYVSSVRGRIAFGALNWQALSTAGVSVYDSAWGTRAHPYGPRTVVVTNGTVRGFLAGSRGAGRPGVGQQFLTAPVGSISTALAKLRIGDAVAIRTAPSGYQLDDGIFPHHPIGRPTALLGVGGAIVRDGLIKATCGARDEQLRPRSAFAWLANGDMIVVTASGRATVNGTRFGGATVHQFAMLLRQLGARTAINLDGGTSTTLLVRRTVGGPLLRLDRGLTEYMRPVADSLVFRA